MSKKMIWALVMLAVVVIVVVLSRGNTDVNLLFTKVSGLKSLIFLAFTAWGVAIGLLLK